jgi:uncharacterized small protein (DUF1192 family)
MAKALYGHLAGNDAVLRWENERLRSRVAQLEAEVERLALELASTSDPALAVVVADEQAVDEFGHDAEYGLRPALA